MKLRHTKTAEATPTVDTSACGGVRGAPVRAPGGSMERFRDRERLFTHVYHRYLLPSFLFFYAPSPPLEGGPCPTGGQKHEVTASAQNRHLLYYCVNSKYLVSVSSE